jgi:hypothetical protein
MRHLDVFDSTVNDSPLAMSDSQIHKFDHCLRISEELVGQVTPLLIIICTKPRREGFKHGYKQARTSTEGSLVQGTLEVEFLVTDGKWNGYCHFCAPYDVD